MTLRARLIIGLVSIVLLLIAPLLLMKQSLDALGRSVNALSADDVAASLLLARMHAATDELRKAELGLVYGSESSPIATRRARVDSAMRAIEAKTDSLKGFGMPTTSEEVRATLDSVGRVVPREIEALRRGRDAYADTLSLYTVGPQLSRIDSLLGESERSVSARTANRAGEATREAARGQRVTDGALVAALLVAGLIAVWLTSTISNPVRDLEEGMEAVAEGDFSHSLKVAPLRGDEFGRLARGYHQMVDQLRQLDALKAEIVSVASHELKTPINVIIGYLQLLQEDVYGDLTPQQREICATLSTQAQALARLVRQLLDVSRFEAGGGKLDVRPVRLRFFLEELEDAFRVLAMQRGITFAIEHGENLPGEVHWDPDRMSEVLGNLLSNAFKFTDRGGRVALSVDATEHSVHMEVRDTGAGISPEHLPYIFHKFFQANNQASASTKGTGLGLAIAKSIVDVHGGSINVESTPGVGTTFAIALPIRATVGRQAAHVDDGVTVGMT